ncbi:MAG: putative signal peptide protein [Actinomycetota bacterium]
MNFSIAQDLELALSLADQVKELSMSRYLSGSLVIETKPDMTPVTDADRAVEQLIREQLALLRPDDLIVGEEFGGDYALAAGRRWIIDPIDGTKNYMRGVPVWANLISLAVDDDIVVGVVAAPALNRRWWAGVGLGAFTQDADGSTRQIHVSAISKLADASFSFSDSVGWDLHGDRGPQVLQELQDQTWRSRGYGDFLSHMFVAEGAVDIAAEPQLSPWDVAALVPIVTEAGGKLTGFDGRPALVSGSGLTTNGLLHDQVLAKFVG